MIIVRLMGGLGNQMFQYAAGRRLAHLHGTSLKFDQTLLGRKSSGRTPRAFALAPFAVQASVASPGTLGNFPLVGRLWHRRLRRRFLHIREKHFHFDSGILELPDNVCLEGHWQSEKYFSDIADVIRKDFTVVSPLEGLNREFAARIRSHNSVSVHIRRGDYVSNPAARELHGVCGPGYYRAAVDMMAERIREPHFFIFSDDPVWVRKNFALAHPMTVVEHNGAGRAHEDLRLMNLCCHHIIANSTFSWWGAWLSESAGKIVVSPARWFGDAAMDARDVYPHGWIRI